VHLLLLHNFFWRFYFTFAIFRNCKLIDCWTGYPSGIALNLWRPQSCNLMEIHRHLVGRIGLHLQGRGSTSLNCRYIFTRLHGGTSTKIIVFTLITVITQNFTLRNFSFRISVRLLAPWLTVFVVLIIIARSVKRQKLRLCFHSYLVAIQILSCLVQYNLSYIVEHL